MLPKPLGKIPDSLFDVVFCSSREIGYGIDGQVLGLGAPEGEDEVGDTEVERQSDGEGKEESLVLRRVSFWGMGDGGWREGERAYEEGGR